MFISSVLFGEIHFVNWISGQPIADTIQQVTHAFYIGIMYAALRLRIGSILPVIFLHGLWDSTVTIMGSTTASLATHMAKTMAETSTVLVPDGGLAVSIAFFSLEPLYGLFVLWRWYVWRKSQSNANV